MVKFDYRYGLPFCEMTIEHKGSLMTLDNILLDTGSGGTILKMDEVDKIKFGNLEIKNFNIEIGVMDYGFEINGIIGIDFMKHIGAIIDLDKMIVSARDTN